MEIQIGDITNRGTVLFIDKPWINREGKPADVLVKTDEYHKEHKQDFTWLRLSEVKFISRPIN